VVGLPSDTSQIRLRLRSRRSLMGPLAYRTTLPTSSLTSSSVVMASSSRCQAPSWSRTWWRASPAALGVDDGGRRIYIRIFKRFTLYGASMCRGGSSAMTQQLPSAVVDRPVVGSYATYAAAQRAVDFLSDNKFPVEHTAIIGSDLRMVETVLGRLTRGRAALAGVGTGAWFGLLIGLLLSVFALGSHNVFVLILSGILYGAVFGAIAGFVGHALSGGHRDFSSRSQIVAARYDVAADPEVAEEAKNMLTKLQWREG
jgi:hypothetical protein